MPLPPGPTLPGTYPDPSVQRVGDDYYLVNSTFEYFPALPIFHSVDLVSWTQIGNAIDRIDQLDLSTVPNSCGLFAPTLRFSDGVWYLICTVVAGEGRQGNFFVTARDPAGPWSDPTWIDEADGIDPSLFFDEDGRAWFVGNHAPANPQWDKQTTIWMREFDVVTGQVFGPMHELWSGALIGAWWAEGPHIYRRGDWYYLLASEGGTEWAHALSVARSRTITGPYEGYRGNPVLTHRHFGRTHPVMNVGHADLFEKNDGSWASAVLATRPYGGYHANLGRETFIVDVEWQDDWPVFAPGVGQVLAGDPYPEIAPAMPEELEWTQVRTARDVNPIVDVEAGTVTFTSNHAPLDQIGTPAFVGVRQRHMNA